MGMLHFMSVFVTCNISYLDLSNYVTFDLRQGVLMKPIAVTEKLAVAPQPMLSDFQELRRLGFATVVNNRPDGEDPSQLGSVAEEEAARAAGLAYVHIPVTSTGMSEDDARLLKETIEQAPGPVVAPAGAARAPFTFGFSQVLSIHIPMRSCLPRRRSSASTPTRSGHG
jgi:uncharacterized protein (TIGR01244 family)